MYITKADYAARMSTALLEQLLTDDDASEDELLQAASSKAEGYITSLAGVYYNTATELAKTGNLRNGLVLKLALDIATYELYQRIDDAQIPDKVVKNYNDAIDSLEEVAKGKLPLNLDPKETGGDGTGGGDTDEDVNTVGRGRRRIGSQAKRTHRP